MARTYNPDLPLVFVHLPRTGGTSLMSTLRGWFPGRVFLGSEHMAEARACAGVVCDHWDRRCGKDAAEIAGPDGQYVTFLREPARRLASIYAHLHDNRAVVQHGGRTVNVGDLSCTEYATMFKDELENGFVNFMPSGTYPAFLGEFVAVGFTENYQQSLNKLADALRKPKVPMVRLNGARPREIPDEATALYVEAARREKTIYDQARQWCGYGTS